MKTAAKLAAAALAALGLAGGGYVAGVASGVWRPVRRVADNLDEVAQGLDELGELPAVMSRVEGEIDKFGRIIRRLDWRGEPFGEPPRSRPEDAPVLIDHNPNAPGMAGGDGVVGKGG